MLDLALFAFFGLMMVLGLRHPFVWVLAYIYLDILAPQKIGWSLMQVLPLSLIAFGAAFGGWLVLDGKEGARFTGRQVLILALLVYCGATLGASEFPDAAAAKWAWVWKALVFALFLPLALRNWLRIEAALLVIVLTSGCVIVSAGVKTLLSGGGYGELSSLVRDNSGLYEGSTLSAMAVAMIPLVLWFARFGTLFAPKCSVTIFAGALVFAAVLVPIGTQARTGLVCLCVLGLLVLWRAKNKFLLGALGAAALLVAVPFLPADYTARMATISAHEEDQSASTRVAVWRWTLDYVANHPLGGGFDAYRGNSFTYTTQRAVGEGSAIRIETAEVTEKARAYHSAYFEMLGEQGWPGLVLWLALHLSGIVQMGRLRARLQRRPAYSGDAQALRCAALAGALQQCQWVYLAGAAFIGIAYQPVMLMLLAVQMALGSYAAGTFSPLQKRDRRSVSEVKFACDDDEMSRPSPVLRQS